jgi:hypothetical protein
LELSLSTAVLQQVASRLSGDRDVQLAIAANV